MKEIETLREIHKAEKKRLQELRDHFVPIDRNLAVIAEENRIIVAEEDVR